MSEKGFEFLNPACEEITGLSNKYLKECGLDFLNLLHPDDKKLVLERYQARKEGKSIPPTHQVRFNAKDGTIKYLEFDTASIPNQQGSVIGIIRDITKQKLNEEKLRESEAKFRGLVERANEGIVIVQDGLIIYVNPYMEKICGFTQEEFIDQPFHKFVATGSVDMMVDRHKRRNLGESVLSNYEAVLKNKFSKRVHVDISINEFTSAGKTAYLTVIHDITKHKDLEDQILTTLDKLRHAMDGTIQAIGMILESRDPYTAGHQRRVSDLACSIAIEMGLSEEQIDTIQIAGTLHDLGKIAIPAEILAKPTALTATEFSLIKNHPSVAYDILKKIDFPWAIADIVHQHHERLDGSGYPQGLKGDQILLESRILAVADIVEAMISHRPYRAARSLEEALAELSQHKGELYDPEAAEACIKLFKEKGFDFQEWTTGGHPQQGFSHYLKENG